MRMFFGNGLYFVGDDFPEGVNCDGRFRRRCRPFAFYRVHNRPEGGFDAAFFADKFREARRT